MTLKLVHDWLNSCNIQNSLNLSEKNCGERKIEIREFVQTYFELKLDRPIPLMRPSSTKLSSAFHVSM